MSLLSNIANFAANVVRQVQQNMQAQQAQQQPAQCPAPTNTSQQPANLFSQSSFQIASTPLVNLTGETGRMPGPLPPPTGSGYQAGQYLMVNHEAGGLNLRTGPSTGDSRIEELAPDTPLEVTAPPPPECGPAQQGDWVHVRAPDGSEGWVNTGYVTQMDAQQADTLRHNQEAVEANRGLYLNQFDAEKEVGGDGANANCGPSSGVVAFRQQGLEIPDISGIEHNGTTGADVQAMRYLMYHDVNEAQDGVYEGHYSLDGDNNENKSFTGFTGLENAVTEAQGSFYYPGTDAASIRGAVEAGSTVIISGSFVTDARVPVTDDTPEPLRGPEGTYRDYNRDGQADLDTEGNPIYARAAKDGLWPRGGHAEEHLLTVVDTTPEGNFVIIDSADPGGEPRVVTPEQLEGFMEGNAGAMAIDGPNSPHRQPTVT